MSKVEELFSLTKPLAESLGLEIWGIDIVGGNKPILRIFVESSADKLKTLEKDNLVDNCTKKALLSEALSSEALSGEFVNSELSDSEFNSQAGVNIDECAHLSRLVAINLEAENLFPSAYILEVSSPGLERNFFKLSQLQDYLGSEVELSLEEANTKFANRRRFSGNIKAVNLEHNSFSLSIEDEDEIELDWANIKRIKLIYTFPENKKKVLNKKVK